MDAGGRRSRDEKIISLHNSGMKQKDIAGIMGVGQSTVSMIICAYNSQKNREDEMAIMRYRQNIALTAFTLKAGDRVKVINGDEEFLATVEEKYKYTVLCKDDLGFRCCPKYQDVQCV